MSSGTRRRLVALAGLLAALAFGASLAAPDTAALRSGETALRFGPEVLADLGLALADVDAASSSLREGALAFPLDAERSRIALQGGDRNFEGFATGTELRHTGGFSLRRGAERIDLAGFVLVPAAAPYALELRDARGARWLFVDRPHALYEKDGLSVANADLLIAPELAALLGRPELAGTYIGVLDAELFFAPPPSAARSAQALGGEECAGDFTQPVDLLMLTLTGMSQAAREAGGRVAMAPAATVRNLGPGDVQWYRAIAPAGPLGPHPYLALHFYRLSNGVLEQVGRADLKHTFFATNTNCDCPSGQILYAGCEDLYGVSTNLDRANLAPRSELDVSTMTWSSLGSHFDGVPVDNFRSHFGDGSHDAFQHRLVVTEPQLQTPGARFFYDGWYMAPNDSDLENSMAHREVDPSLAGSTWSFPTIDGGIANGSILDVFVDPDAVPPGAASSLHDTGAGRVQLAVVSSDLGGGVFHYEYALMNFDFERQVNALTLPVGAGQTVTNAGFGDANGNALDDWTVSVAADHVTWTAPPGNALDWGTLYNFRMDVNAPPAESGATLAPLAPGTPATVFVHTVPEPGVAASSVATLALLSLLARYRRR
jgi:hypothetical protein